MSQAGIFTHPITILRHTVTRNEFGEQVDTYTPSVNTKAQIRGGGRRTTENNEVIIDFTKEFVMRYYVPVHDFDRIKTQEDNEEWRIININKDEFRHQIIISAQKVNK